jgi:hypothetical protein
MMEPKKPEDRNIGIMECWNVGKNKPGKPEDWKSGTLKSSYFL